MTYIVELSLRPVHLRNLSSIKEIITNNAIKKNCDEGDLNCRRRQRQAILQWAYDPHI